MTTHPLDRPALRKGRVSRLTPNASLIQGTTWQCNCIVVRKGQNALAGDGFWNPMDVDTLAEMVEGYNTHLLITHGDIDHCTCIGRCTSAKAVGALATAARMRSGSAGHDLKLESAKWGLTFVGEPRIDLEVRPPECVRLGEWTVRTSEAAGRAGDGTAYLIQEEGIFLVGGDAVPATPQRRGHVSRPRPRWQSSLDYGYGLMRVRPVSRRSVIG